jgi:hypothetical protein
VNLIGLEIGSQAKTQDPSTFFLDSIQVTGDIAGPFDFTFNVQPLMRGYIVTGTAFEWTPAAPAAR